MVCRQYGQQPYILRIGFAAFGALCSCGILEHAFNSRRRRGVGEKLLAKAEIDQARCFYAPKFHASNCRDYSAEFER